MKTVNDIAITRKVLNTMYNELVAKNVPRDNGFYNIELNKSQINTLQQETLVGSTVEVVKYKTNQIPEYKNEVGVIAGFRILTENNNG